MNTNLSKRPTRPFLTSRNAFKITLYIIPMTIISIWAFGLGQHRTLFTNALLSTSILSIAFLLFLTISLYMGVKLKDDLGKIITPVNIEKNPFSKGMDIPDPGGFIDDAEGCLVGIALWIGVTILAFLFIWLVTPLLWAMVLVFIAMLYWIFFRALRLVFKKSNKCKGDLKSSFMYGAFYTFLYSSWIYIIILGSHYLDK